MGKCKENTKYNVVSMRISDEEMLVLEEMTRRWRDFPGSVTEQVLGRA